MLPRANNFPPPSIGPRKTCTSSAPAQPSAAVSTNQPLTVIGPNVEILAPLLGVSIAPRYVLSPCAPSPGCQAWAKTDVAAKSAARAVDLTGPVDHVAVRR